MVLKGIRPDRAQDPRFIRMFVDEARVAATLHHQHIVQVYDIGEANGEYFLTMEYVHGENVCWLELRDQVAGATEDMSTAPTRFAGSLK